MTNPIRHMADLELDQILARVCRRQPLYEDVVDLIEEDGSADIELLVAVQKEKERRRGSKKTPNDYTKLCARYNNTNHRRKLDNYPNNQGT